MKHRDFVFECDYGESGRILNTLRFILTEQDAAEFSMCTIFVNNNPYNLELFVVLSYESPQPNQIKIATEAMKSVGARNRPDITMNELFDELSKKRFNVMNAAGPETLELFGRMFQYRERSQVANTISMRPLGNKQAAFISHSSADKPFVEDVIPYLNNQGLPVWYDKAAIDYGESIVSKIQEGVKDSGAVIFYISQDFLKSSWCSFEMEGFLTRHAGGQKILIISIVAPDVTHEELPFFLQGMKYLKTTHQHSPQMVANEIFPTIKKHFSKT